MAPPVLLFIYTVLSSSKPTVNEAQVGFLYTPDIRKKNSETVTKETERLLNTIEIGSRS